MLLRVVRPSQLRGTQGLLRWALSGKSLGGWVAIRCILLESDLMSCGLQVLIEDIWPQRGRAYLKAAESPARWWTVLATFAKDGRAHRDKCPTAAPPKCTLIRNQAANHDRRAACWASAGYQSAGCAVVEQALRECMDGPKPPPKAKNNINYHLSRFKKYLEGNTKKK